MEPKAEELQAWTLGLAHGRCSVSVQKINKQLKA